MVQFDSDRIHQREIFDSGTYHLSPPHPRTSYQDPRQPSLREVDCPEPNTCLSWASHYALEETNGKVKPFQFSKYKYLM